MGALFCTACTVAAFPGPDNEKMKKRGSEAVSVRECSVDGERTAIYQPHPTSKSYVIKISFDSHSATIESEEAVILIFQVPRY